MRAAGRQASVVESGGPARSERCRVAHVITDLDIGGAERMLVKLLEAVHPAIDNLVVTLCEPGPLAAEIERLGIPVVSLGLARGEVRLAALLRAVRTLRGFRPHVLQSWMYHADLLATLVFVMSGRPALAWNLRCADMELERYSPITRCVRGVLARLSRVPRVVVCNSRASRDAHAAYGYRPRRWELIPNGFDTAVFRPSPTAARRLREEFGLEAANRVVGMVARRDPAKDHETLLAAAARVCGVHPEVRFLLVGSGVPALAPRVQALGLAGRVLLEEARSDVAGLTAGLDLCVLSSAFGESFPNALGEAMACGVPCVSTDVGDVADLLADCGLVVPRRDPAALAGALCEALAWSPAERERRARRGRERIERDYALDTIAARYRTLFEALRPACAA